VNGLNRELPTTAVQAPTLLLPSQQAQAASARILRDAQLSPAAVRAGLAQAADRAGFRPGVFEPFEDRLPRVLDPDQRLTHAGYLSHGFGELIGRFITGADGAWTIATYVFPQTPGDASVVRSLVDARGDSQTLTGLPVVNAELAERFLPQFLKGLVIGTVVVVVIILLAFREWRLSLLALLPTAIGLVWTAGLLALLGVELDLFALFAVVTFVGIGVDYGIHLVHRFRERGNAARAISELAPVILVAGAITMLGYGTLLISSYPPLRSIGLVSALSVVALGGASVLVLPALLVSRSR
jgi:predicted exporter